MKKWLAGLCLALIWACGLAGLAYADTARSNSYELDESFIGGGGLIQSGSANYQVGEAIGDTASGNSTSTNFQTNAGFNTSGDPALAFAVDDANVNFGSFSASSAATATSSFEVANYTSYGYVVQIVGNAPRSGSHTINAMTVSGSSQAGSEQFGINLVANTSPVSFGANPDHGQFGFGAASPNYGTANHFRYVSGETIASAPKSSGKTVYTISYLVNVSSLTPGGNYNSSQVIVCTGTY